MEVSTTHEQKFFELLRELSGVTNKGLDNWENFWANHLDIYSNKSENLNIFQAAENLKDEIYSNLRLMSTDSSRVTYYFSTLRIRIHDARKIFRLFNRNEGKWLLENILDEKRVTYIDFEETEELETDLDLLEDIKENVDAALDCLVQTIEMLDPTATSKKTDNTKEVPLNHEQEPSKLHWTGTGEQLYHAFKQLHEKGLLSNSKEYSAQFIARHFQFNRGNNPGLNTIVKELHKTDKRPAKNNRFDIVSPSVIK